jgi:hypothetical protein
MRTKLVTGYWMDIVEKGYTGAMPARKSRYLGSIISHCRGFQYPVVCYTHARNLNELQTIKEEYNLTNLEIKVKELSEIKYSRQIRGLQDNKTQEEIERFCLSGRPPEVMWGKFDVMKEECTDDVDYVYWVDAGLQSNQIFPYRHCPDKDAPDLHQHPYKQYNFTLVFNREMLDKLTQKSDGKFVTLVGTNPQDGYHSFQDYSPKPGNYPIAGFFGGAKEVVREYCDLFTQGVNKHIEAGILCFEQAIMKYVTDTIEPSKLQLHVFETHQTGIDVDTFHYKVWDSSLGLPKPIFRIWEEILEN